MQETTTTAPPRPKTLKHFREWRTPHFKGVKIRSIQFKILDHTAEYGDITPIRNPEEASIYFRKMVEGEPVEKFMVLCLNSMNKPLVIQEVTSGLVNSSLTHPREVFKIAIACNAVSIIIAHNHPSGNPEPSAEDLAITRQLMEAGKIIGIPIHDHVIIADNKYTSFAERGLM